MEFTEDRFVRVENDIYKTAEIAHNAGMAVYETRNVVEELVERVARLEEELRMRGKNNEFAEYAKKICIGLNKAFRDHFENDEFEITDREFYDIIYKELENTFPW